MRVQEYEYPIQTRGLQVRRWNSQTSSESVPYSYLS